MSAIEGAYLLRKRADSYASDAEALRRHGDTIDAPGYDLIARELRAAAEFLEALAGASAANAAAGAVGAP